MGVEIELKFRIPPDRLAAVQRALATSTAQRQSLAAVYFDTAAQHLARARVALRLRREDRQWVQTLKAEGSSPLQRLEHNVALSALAFAPEARRSHGATPSLDPARHDGTAAGEALRRALRKLADPALEARNATRVERLTRRIRHDGALIELALDVGQLSAGERVLPLCELEFELLRGPPTALLDLAARWVQRFALVLDVRSKSERGEQLAAGRTVGPPQSAARVELGAAPDADAAVRAMLGGALSQALANAAPVAAGEHEAEHLHQLRVALRRLRNLLRVFGRAGSGSDEAAGDGAGDADADLVERLSQVYSRLGASRDRDVAMVTLWPALLAAGAPRVEWPVDDDPTAAPPAVLSEPAVQQLWLDLLRRVWLVPPATEVPAEPAADEPPDAPHEPHEHAGADTAMTTSAATSDATDAVAAALAPALAALQRSLRREATSFADLNDAGRHRLRRRLKRLSDAAELSQPLWPQRALRRLLRRLRRAQSALGEFSDTVMAIDRYRSLASVDPSAWFAVGWLSARRQTLLAPCEQALQHFAALRPRWRP